MLSREDFDVIVIGAGPGGYVAAIRCAQLGLKTACVDEWVNHQGEYSLGGTCLNVGCIPSKALLESSHHYAQAQQAFSGHGIRLGRVGLDLPAMQARKQQVVEALTGGIGALFRQNGVRSFSGRGKIRPADNADRYTVVVKNRLTRKKTAKLTAPRIIVATGSSPIRLSQAPITDGYILDSAAALELETVPPTLGIIGAGAIGLELGSIWQRLGAQVTLLEAMPVFLPMLDESIRVQAGRSFRQQGLKVQTGARLVAAEVVDGKVRVDYEVNSQAKQQQFDKLVVAVGRKPNSERVFGKEYTAETDERGFLLVDSRYETSVPGVYAIGDVIGGAMLAHKASRQAVTVAEQIAGKRPVVNDTLVPAVIYTAPEIAWVGLDEAACKQQGLDYRSGRFPLSASGRARAAGHAEGMVKLIGEAGTDRLLGAHLFAPHASEMIAQAVLTMEMQGTVEDLMLTTFAHPSLSEAIQEAALAVHGRAIHSHNH